MTKMAGGGETKSDPSGFTIDTLRVLHDTDMESMRRLLVEYDKRYSERFSAQEIRTEQRFAATEQAIGKQERAVELRFESVNEFRAQLADQASRFMPRNESIARHERTGEQLDAHAASLNEFRNRMAEALSQINSRLDLTAGRSTGLDKGWGYLIGAAGFIAAIVAIVIAVGK